MAHNIRLEKQNDIPPPPLHPTRYLPTFPPKHQQTDQTLPEIHPQLDTRPLPPSTPAPTAIRTVNPSCTTPLRRSTTLANHPPHKRPHLPPHALHHPPERTLIRASQLQQLHRRLLVHAAPIVFGAREKRGDEQGQERRGLL